MSTLSPSTTLPLKAYAPSQHVKSVGKATDHPALGVVAISHNEESDMPGFLEHLLPWVDEIIIVDDGSMDRTADIARAAGPKVKFIVSPRSEGESWADQRNKGIAAAASDWLLHMDIDERVTPELAREILTAIRDTSTDAYRYRRLNFSLHRPQRGRRAWNKTQLTRRTCSRFVGKVHETCLLESESARVGQLQGFMWHLKESDYVERVRKNVIYMQVEAENLLERGVRVQWFHLLVHPLYRACKYYFFQGGIRDGVLGVLDAMFVLTGTFNWYATAWDRTHAISRSELETRLKHLWRTKGTMP